MNYSSAPHKALALQRRDRWRICNASQRQRQWQFVFTDRGCHWQFVFTDRGCQWQFVFTDGGVNGSSYSQRQRGCQWQFVFTETERVSVAVRIYRQGMSVTVHIHTNRGGVRGNSYSQRQGVSVAESVHYWQAYVLHGTGPGFQPCSARVVSTTCLYRQQTWSTTCSHHQQT